MTTKSGTGKKPGEDGLTGKLLLAMPGMGDPRFHRAVIFICSHDESGAMGLVINNILSGVDMASLLEQLEICPQDEEKQSTLTDTAVLSGGPVETARGFILHTPDFQQADTIAVNDNFSITGTLDALKAISAGRGPKICYFFLAIPAGARDNLMKSYAIMRG